jgi:F-type H+-transporting ATPase subunit delta
MVEARHATVLDPVEQQLGKVYAEALLGAAQKAGNAEAVLAELNSLVRDVLQKLPQFDAVLQLPKVSHEEKARLLDNAFQGKMSVVLLNFLKVLTRRGRFSALRAIERAAQKLHHERTGRTEVQVRTAEPLSPDMYARVMDRLRQSLGREPVLHVEVDPDLIGGVVIRIGDTVYDGSVAHQLVRLRDETAAKIAREIRQSSARFALAD